MTCIIYASEYVCLENQLNVLLGDRILYLAVKSLVLSGQMLLAIVTGCHLFMYCNIIQYTALG